MYKPSIEDVEALLALKKSLVRIMEWTDRPSNKTPRWVQFESKCIVGTRVSEEATFRAHYRPAGVQSRGAATIKIPEALYVSIALKEHRVAAFDTLVGQKHVNKNVPGLPFSGQKISSTSHWHRWSIAGDGYVEPVEPPILEVDLAIAYFCDRANLFLNGPFKHPMYGLTAQLI